jgi:hypothetical protein
MQIYTHVTTKGFDKIKSTLNNLDLYPNILSLDQDSAFNYTFQAMLIQLALSFKKNNFLINNEVLINGIYHQLVILGCWHSVEKNQQQHETVTMNR